MKQSQLNFNQAPEFWRSAPDVYGKNCLMPVTYSQVTGTIPQNPKVQFKFIVPCFSEDILTHSTLVYSMA